jgi:hypothetical protein
MEHVPLCALMWEERVEALWLGSRTHACSPRATTNEHGVVGVVCVAVMGTGAAAAPATLPPPIPPSSWARPVAGKQPALIWE